MHEGEVFGQEGFLCKSSTRMFAFTVFPISTCIVQTEARGMASERPMSPSMVPHDFL